MAGDSIHIRLAILEDVGIVARHRAEMFRHMALAWIEEHDIMRVVLHASAEGRPLYEKLGFRQTREMRLHRG